MQSFQPARRVSNWLSELYLPILRWGSTFVIRVRQRPTTGNLNSAISPNLAEKYWASSVGREVLAGIRPTRVWRSSLPSKLDAV